MPGDFAEIGMRLDSSRLADDATRIGTELDRLVTPLAQKIADNFSTPLKGLFAKLAGVFSVSAAANQYIQAADAVGELSESLNVDVEELQAWEGAAARSGGSAQAFQVSLRNLSNQAAGAAGGVQGIAQTFQKLGVAYKDAQGNSRNTIDILQDLADKADKLNKQEFAGLAKKLGLDTGTIQLLQTGRAKVDELIARQKELGLYTKEDTEIAKKAKLAMDDFQQAAKMLSAQLMRIFVPALTFVTEKFTKFLSFLREHAPFIIAVASLAGIAAAVVKLSSALSALEKAAWKAWRPFIPWAIAIGTAALVLDDLYAYMQGGESYFENFWSMFGTGEEITQFLTDAWNGFKNAVNAVLDVIRPFAPELFKIGVFALIAYSAFTVFKGLAAIFSPVGLAIMGIALAAYLIYENWAPISQWFKQLWDNIKQIFEGFSNFVSGIFTGDFSLARKGIEQAWEGLKAFFQTIWNGVMGVFTSAVNFIGKLFGVDDAANKFMGSWDGVVAFFTDMWGSITKIFDDAGKLIKGVLDGVANAWKAVKELVGGVGEQAKDVVKFYGDHADTDWDENAADNVLDMSANMPATATAADTVRASSLQGGKPKVEQTVQSTVNVGKVEVVTQATDAEGIAGAMAPALQNRGRNADIVYAVATGTVQK